MPNEQKSTEKSILEDFLNCLKTTKEKPNLYYNSKNGELFIVVVVKDSSSPLENKIYKAEWKILKKYPKVNISVRVIPKLNNPYKNIVPSNFQKYNYA